MAKILLHNLSIPYVDQYSDLYHFDKNAIYFADASDSIIVRGAPPDPALMKFLVREGIVASPLTFLSSSLPSAPFSVFQDVALVQQIKQHSNLNIDELDVFMPTEYEAQLASDLSFNYPYSADQYDKYVGKSLFRQQCKELGVPIPVGQENLKSIQQVIWLVIKMLFSGISEGVVKQNDGVAGLAARRLTTVSLLKSIFGLSKIMPPYFVQPGSFNYMVEQWHKNVVASPSIQCFINKVGGIEILSMHDQIMKDNKMTYAGCASEHWLTEEVQQTLMQYSKRHAELLASEGYFGHVAYNAILLSDGRLLFTETNPRRVMSSYPFKIISNLGYSRVTMPPYKTFSITREAWVGKGAEVVLSDLSEDLFLQNKKVGLIPFDVKLLNQLGTVMVLAIGVKKSEVDNYVKKYG